MYCTISKKARLADFVRDYMEFLNKPALSEYFAKLTRGTIDGSISVSEDVEQKTENLDAWLEEQERKELEKEAKEREKSRARIGF